MKVILNKQFGGFRPSFAAHQYYAHKKGLELFAYKPTDYYGHYRRVEDPDGLFVTFTTKDYGDIVKADDVDWDDVLSLDAKYREDPALIEAVEALGPAASTYVSNLVVVEIPDGLDYVIDDYDGWETLHQRVEEW